MSGLKIGDPITKVSCVSISGKNDLIFTYTYVTGIDAEYLDTEVSNDLRISSEGVYWVRGHIRRDSDEAKALSVAFALRYL